MKPLTPSVFHILVALVNGERHGYAIMQDVLQQTSGLLVLGPGTVYGCLNRMVAAGLVEETEARAVPDEDERRRYYRITSKGRRTATWEVERLAMALAAAQGRRVVPEESL